MIGDRKRILFLTLVRMTLVSLVVAFITIYAFYQVALSEQRSRLAEVVHSQSRMIMAIASKNRTPEIFPQELSRLTLLDLAEIYQKWEGFGETGEFMIARRNSDRIEFLLNVRKGRRLSPPSITYPALASDPGGLIKQGLLGYSDTRVGEDYRGVPVLAAYTPSESFDWVVLAQMDLSEIRAPFFHATIIACGSGTLIILFGAAFCNSARR